MEQIKEFVDERQKAWCIHCGGWATDRRGTSRDHVPSKALLRKPYPANLPVVEVCRGCNSGFARDEEYLTAFLGCVLSGSTEPARQLDEQVARTLNSSPKLKARIEKSATTYNTIGGDARSEWRPEYDRINRVVVKNARGHAFFEFGEPMLGEPSRVWCAPLEALSAGERIGFETIDAGGGWPEVGSRMMTRVLTGQDMSGGWVIVQDGIYRYGVAHSGPMLVRTVLREYLATEVLWSA